MNQDLDIDHNDENIQAQPKKSKKLTVIIASIILLLLVGFAFLYWFQMRPEHREELEEITGMDLTAIDTIARNVGEQTNSVISRTPLGETLRTQEVSTDSTEQEILENDDAQSETESQIQAETLPAQPILQEIDDNREILTENQIITTPNAQQSTINNQATSPSQASTNQSGTSRNIIEPPANAPVLNLVTEADPEDQAQQDEEARQRALAEIENALQNPNTTSLSEEELLAMEEYHGELAGDSINSVEDRVISRNFVSDVALYLVNNYVPGENSGTINASPISMNIYYGTNLKELPQAGGFTQAREYILSYVYTPSMLQGLYSAYSSQFIEDMQSYAAVPMGDREALSQEEQQVMFQDYSDYLNSLASATQSVIDVPNLREKAQEHSALFAAMTATKNNFAEIQVQYEEARYNNENTEALREEMLLASQEIERASEELEAMQSSILSEIQNNGNSQFSDATLLYIFEWIGRREANNQAQAQSANQELVTLCRELAEKLAEASE